MIHEHRFLFPDEQKINFVPSVSKLTLLAIVYRWCYLLSCISCSLLLLRGGSHLYLLCIQWSALTFPKVDLTCGNNHGLQKHFVRLPTLLFSTCYTFSPFCRGKPKTYKIHKTLKISPLLAVVTPGTLEWMEKSTNWKERLALLTVGSEVIDAQPQGFHLPQLSQTLY